MIFTEALSRARPPVIGAATRKLALLAMTALPLCLGGCKSLSMTDMTGSITKPDTELPSAPEDVRRYTQAWEKRYDSRPNDKETVLAYQCCEQAVFNGGRAGFVPEETRSQILRMLNSLWMRVGKNLQTAPSRSRCSSLIQIGPAIHCYVHVEAPRQSNGKRHPA